MGLVQMGSEEFSFFSFFFTFFRFSSLFSYSRRGQGGTTVIYCKNAEFHSDPSAPTLCKSSRENEIFKRATHQGLCLWRSLKVKIEFFKRD